MTTASAKRVVTATCRQGVEMSSSPTPPIDLEVMAKASQRSPKKLRNSIPDTGCTSTVIKSAEAAKLKLKIDKNMEINLTDATGKQMRMDGNNVYQNCPWCNKEDQGHCLTRFGRFLLDLLE